MQFAQDRLNYHKAFTQRSYIGPVARNTARERLFLYNRVVLTFMFLMQQI